jgi:hypothetical protein
MVVYRTAILLFINELILRHLHLLSTFLTSKYPRHLLSPHSIDPDKSSLANDTHKYSIQTYSTRSIDNVSKLPKTRRAPCSPQRAAPATSTTNANVYSVIRFDNASRQLYQPESLPHHRHQRPAYMHTPRRHRLLPHLLRPILYSERRCANKKMQTHLPPYLSVNLDAHRLAVVLLMSNVSRAVVRKHWGFKKKRRRGRKAGTVRATDSEDEGNG